jgi:hypothetical protein
MSEHESPARLTVVPPAARVPDGAEDFPREEDVERRATYHVRAASSSAPVDTQPGAEFSSEFPSEEDKKYQERASAVGAIPHAPAPPRRALLGGPSKAAWIAVGCAVLAIAEAGIIAGRIHWRSANPSNAAGVNPRQSAQTVTDPPRSGDPSSPDLGASRPIPPQGGAAAVSAASPDPALGSQLEVTSDPSGAHVSVDDRARGSTPLTLDVSPGPHTVVVSDGTTTSRKTVNAVAGGTATLLASFAPAAVSAGWLTIHSPLDLQVRESDSLLGVTSADRLMMAAGRHVLDLSNADVAFQTRLTVVVEPGKTATSTVAIPNGSLSLNALPWANVTLDGEALAGTTPFANLEVPIGPHEIVWMHPQLGERRQTVIVTTKGPVRVVVDLRVK